MKKSTKLMEIKLERTIPAPPAEVFDAWLDPKTPGTPWNEGDKLLLTPKVDGFFYWLINDTHHYGRFTEVDRPARIQHTWMSRFTLGEETKVTVTFKKKGEDTLMTLVHSDLPDGEEGRMHDEGWTHFLNVLVDHFGSLARRRK
jgi:uncharacterized protein YndB with AHSA1/START domain